MEANLHTEQDRQTLRILELEYFPQDQSVLRQLDTSAQVPHGGGTVAQ
jgi:hypothetical protein